MLRRLIEIFDQMVSAGVVTNAKEVSHQGESFIWYVAGYDAEQQALLEEMLGLVGMTIGLDGSAVRIPLRQGVGSSNDSIHISTRSAFDVLSAVGDGIQIPEDHINAGLAARLESAYWASGRLLLIKSSKEQPQNATVSIQFRDWWFYVDETDIESKRGFQFLRTLVGIRLADPDASSRSPVITVPVGG